MRYAILVKNRVIDVTDRDIEPVYPPTSDGYIPVSKPCDKDTILGMYYHSETQTFDFNAPDTTRPPSQADRIEESQLIIMEAIADQYEQGLENRLDDMEVQATIFESILAIGGEM